MILFYTGLFFFVIAGLTFTYRYTELANSETIKGKIYEIIRKKKTDSEGFSYYVYTPKIEVYDEEEKITKYIYDSKTSSKSRNRYYIGEYMYILKIQTKKGYKYLVKKTYYHYSLYASVVGIVALVLHYALER